MRILHLVPIAAAASMAASCSDPAGPNGPEPGPDPVAIWDATVSGLQGTDGAGGPATCAAAWIMAIEATDTGPVPLVSMRVPDNASLQCGQDEPVKKAGIERGHQFIVHQSSDTVTLLSATTSDTFVVAHFTDSLTLTGRVADARYAGATFQATRRSDSADPNRALYVFFIGADWLSVEVGDTVTITPYAYDGYWDLIPDPPATLTSKAPQIGTLSAEGILRGILPGDVEIRAVLDTFVDAITLVVLPPPASVEITSAPDFLIAPDSGEVVAVARDGLGDQFACCRRFEWTSSNPAVATVTGYGEYGIVASVAPGTVTITARLTTLTRSVTFDVLPAVAELHTDDPRPTAGSP